MLVQNVRKLLQSGTSALAIGLLIAGGVVMAASVVLPTPVMAAEGNQGAGGNDGGHAEGDGGHAGNGPQAQGNGAGGSGDHGTPGGGEDSDESDGRGPEYGKPETGTTGGAPIWAQEGIPEVDLGRLNVARSPRHVLDQAYNEALATLTPSMLELYSMSLPEVQDYLANHWDEAVLLDSPLQNLALLQDAFDGTSVLNTYLDQDNSVDTLAAIFLGVASDKTVPITVDAVEAVTTILGYNLTDAQIAQLAANAELVRQAVLTGHG